MTAPTFEYGDRVRVIGEGRGTVESFHGRLIGVRMDDNTPHLRWAYPDGLVPAMSHQALMVWHAMRAGAKRTNGGRDMLAGQRVRTYWTDDGRVYLSVLGEYRAAS